MLSLLTQLKAIFSQRELAFWYQRIGYKYVYTKNPEYISDERRDREGPRTSTNPETRRPYVDGRAVALDVHGQPEYFERAEAIYIKVNASVASFLVRRLHEAVKRGEEALSIPSIVSAFIETALHDAVAVSYPKVRDVFLSVEEAQRRALTLPTLFSIDLSQNIQIVNRRLILVLRALNLNELDDWLDEIESGLPNPRKRAGVTVFRSPADEKRLLAAAMAKVPRQSQLSDATDEDSVIDTDIDDDDSELGSNKPESEGETH